MRAPQGPFRPTTFLSRARTRQLRPLYCAVGSPTAALGPGADLLRVPDFLSRVPDLALETSGRHLRVTDLRLKASDHLLRAPDLLLMASGRYLRVPDLLLRSSADLLNALSFVSKARSALFKILRNLGRAFRARWRQLGKGLVWKTLFQAASHLCIAARHLLRTPDSRCSAIVRLLNALPFLDAPPRPRFADLNNTFATINGTALARIPRPRIRSLLRIFSTRSTWFRRTRDNTVLISISTNARGLAHGHP